MIKTLKTLLGRTHGYIEEEEVWAYFLFKNIEINSNTSETRDLF